MICDAHIHFFSPGFFDGLGAQMGLPAEGRADAVAARAEWQHPESVETLADRWVAELDKHGVARAALIASLPGDEMSVAAAVARQPSRFVGFFMLNPCSADAVARAERALDAGMRGICLFPAMQRYSLDDERVTAIFELAADHAAKPAVFIHCGVLSVGVRKKLGLASPFEIRFGNPLDVQALALRYPAVPVIIPHFGAGFFREALMAAATCPNILLDTSSSNGWINYVPGLTLQQVFRTALDVAGSDRLLFGTDSSFFPRGWNKAVYDAQEKALGDALIPPDARAKIFGGNFQRVFPA
ncbi:MAG TPA: amidohydrolase family protein [Vicinamibacterales bacterium]|nr:amidohydrolase family protein [Vicinamibacterales bacterium]